MHCEAECVLKMMPELLGLGTCLTWCSSAQSTLPAKLEGDLPLLTSVSTSMLCTQVCVPILDPCPQLPLQSVGPLQTFSLATPQVLPIAITITTRFIDPAKCFGGNYLTSPEI